MVVGNVKTKLVVKMATRIFLKYFIYVVIAVVAFVLADSIDFFNAFYEGALKGFGTWR